MKDTPQRIKESSFPAAGILAATSLWVCIFEKVHHHFQKVTEKEKKSRRLLVMTIFSICSSLLFHSSVGNSNLLESLWSTRFPGILNGKWCNQATFKGRSPQTEKNPNRRTHSSDCMVSGNCRISVQHRSEEFCLEISASQPSNRELPKTNTYSPKWMRNEKFVVQRQFAVQPSITCCGFSTANGKLWASEPLSSGSVHEISRLWLYNSICACLCVGSPWLLQLCEFPKES